MITIDALMREDRRRLLWAGGGVAQYKKELIVYIVSVSGNELSLSFQPLMPLHTLHKEVGVYFLMRTGTYRYDCLLNLLNTMPIPVQWNHLMEKYRGGHIFEFTQGINQVEASLAI